MVEAIWRYPVKSALGEALSSVRIGTEGPEGDRGWACLSADGAVVSAKHPRRWGKLLQVSAAWRRSGETAEVALRVPGFDPLVAGSAEADRVLSTWLGDAVRLTNVVPADARLHRLWPAEPGMIPDWAAAAPGTEAVTGVPGAHPGGRFVDFGALHVVTTAGLRHLEAQGVDADARRFRPNLVLSLDRAPAPGDVLRVGAEVTLRCLLPTPRCAIPGAAHGELAPAPQLLRALGRERIELPGRGRAAAFGFYAEVLTTGTIAVGDTSTPDHEHSAE
ncbi:MAG: MOSC domain-containing protein [Chloroflexota bacterium]